MIIESKLNTFLQYILALLIILDTRTVFANLTYSSLSSYISIFLDLILFLLVLFNFSRNINWRAIIKLLIYMLFVYYFYLVNVKVNKFSYINNFMVMFPLFYLLFSSYSEKKLLNMLRSYRNVIFVISILSLFFYFFGSVLNLIKPNVSLEISWGNVHAVSGYSFLHFDAQKTFFFGKELLRNTSIFVEGPMYVLHLLIATSFTLILDSKLINKYTVIFGFTIITTFSATGTVMYVLLYIMMYLVNNSISIRKIIMYLVIAVLMYYSWNVLVDKQSTRSFNIRYDDYIAGIKAWKENIYFGVGYGNVYDVIKYMSPYRLYNTGLSNSFIVILSQGGLYMLSFYIISILKGFININVITKEKLKITQYFVLQLFLFFILVFPYTSLMMFLLALNFYINSIANNVSKV